MFVDSAIGDHLIRGIILIAISMIWIIVLVRIVGLRSFSKMTNFDFVATVATGSLLAGAGQATGWGAFVQSNTAIGAIFLVQFALAWARKRSDTFEDVIHNRPVLVMYDGRFIDEALRRTRVSRGDLEAKLREANVLDLGDVRAAVLETTGDVSVLHGETLDERLLKGVFVDETVRARA